MLLIQTEDQICGAPLLFLVSGWEELMAVYDSSAIGSIMSTNGSIWKQYHEWFRFFSGMCFISI